MIWWHIALLILGYLVAGFIVSLARMLIDETEFGDPVDFVAFVFWPFFVLTCLVIGPVALARMIADWIQGKDGPEC
jgi:hypothetical protein